ncbi:glycosyltransferase family 10 [Christiangramia sp.]|uniref:glycosyltransferase family 10 domain-containing protein n=1 Tax=Christiangramia sp. TaxID=1931228 RepID=UPI0026140743|nr:glycosyltransferase family 10 [Christiangramia sp.]
MKTIKIWFTDFYKGFDAERNYFYSLLSDMYVIELNQKNPDYLIYSCYGNDYLNYDCIRIYYTGENLVPNFNLCDYAIGFHFIDFGDRYLRYPNFALFKDQFESLLESPAEEFSNQKEFFCNFIYSNSEAAPQRDDFFYRLNRYKKVSSPGSHLNNMQIDIGGRFQQDWMYSKLNFQSKCKFSIAFENSSSPGYTTEKIMHAFIANSIPIYWGNPQVGKDFNNHAFINCHEYNNFEEVIEKVKEIDTNTELYLAMLAQPAFKRNKIPEQLNTKELIHFFKIIFDQDISLARKRPLYGTTAKYQKNLKSIVKLNSKVKNLFSFFR